MSNSRRGGLPGPDRRTGLTPPAMTEADFRRRVAELNGEAPPEANADTSSGAKSKAKANAGGKASGASANAEPEPESETQSGSSTSSSSSNASSSSSSSSSGSGSGSSKKGRGRGRSSKTKRIQRMFGIDEDLDRKLWLYAVYVDKDRSEVINDILRPVVGSMVVYDSRDRKNNRNNEGDSDN